MATVWKCVGIVVLYVVVTVFIPPSDWEKIKLTLGRGKEMVGFITSLCGIADLGAGGRLFAAKAGVPPVASSAALLLVGSSLMLDAGAWGPAIGAGTIITGSLIASHLGGNGPRHGDDEAAVTNG